MRGYHNKFESTKSFMASFESPENPDPFEDSIPV